jgi:hypothetical protein
VLAALWTQGRALAPILAAFYCPAAAVLLTAVVVSQRNGISLRTFTRDPTAFMDARPFVGALSNLGVLGWCAAAIEDGSKLFGIVGWLAYFGRVSYRELTGH